jgi:hypothetical protein
VGSEEGPHLRQQLEVVSKRNMLYFALYKCSSFVCFQALSQKLRKTAIKLCHVRLSTWNNSVPTGWIFMKFDI